MNAPFPQPRPILSAPQRHAQAASLATRAERPEHDARLLTCGGAEARIVLDGTPYVLRITRLGKLILTK